MDTNEPEPGSRVKPAPSFRRPLGAYIRGPLSRRLHRHRLYRGASMPRPRSRRGIDKDRVEVGDQGFDGGAATFWNVSGDAEKALKAAASGRTTHRVPAPSPSSARRSRRFRGDSPTGPLDVAQIFNLPYRRLVVGRRRNNPTRRNRRECCGLQARDTADYKSALRSSSARRNRGTLRHAAHRATLPLRRREPRRSRC